MFKKSIHLFSKKKLLFIFIIACTSIASAQTRDTLDIYKKLKHSFYKHHVTTLLYDAIFTDPAPKQYENKPLSDLQKVEDPNKKYEGKVIRKITIKVFDPFGYSVHDTTREAINSFQKLANHYHVTTRHHIVRNNLLFKQYDRLDLLKFNESERLLRAASYVNDAMIYIDPVPHELDSIDIRVYEHDSWTLDAPVSAGLTSIDATLRDRNLLGLGQRFEQEGYYNASSGANEFKGNYFIENIKRTYISSVVSYTTNKDLTQVGFSFNRFFFSPLTKWAGGLAMNKSWDTFLYNDTLHKEINRYHKDYVTTDVWIGRSFIAKNGMFLGNKGANEATNVIYALGYTDTHYQSRPDFTIDTNKTTANTSFWLASIGFSVRKFYKDQFIYRFGANEDVPEGVLVQGLYGVKYIQETGILYYSGINFSDGNHFKKLGYLSVFGEFGSYYGGNNYNSSTFNAGLYYFSDLKQSNKWYFRQFVNFKYTEGFNKKPSEFIKLNSDEMYGYDSDTIVGRSKMVLNLEAVTYMPYNFIGFRFAPLVLVGYGMLETTKNSLLNSRIYQAYALGLLIRNENLLSSSFEISFGVYPDTPDGNKTITKFNPITSFTLKVRSFAVPRPSPIVYH